MIATLALAILKSLIKNPLKAERLKKELLEIRDGINVLFPGY